jgi:cardiolipin synthase A/B
VQCHTHRTTIVDVARSFWRRMREAGVDVRAVNPPTLGGPLGAIRRDHRKLLAVDGEYASTGGVCISDGWLVTSPETGLPYRDTAVGIRGRCRGGTGLRRTLERRR